MRYAYYPGCAAEATVKEADRAARAIAPLLGLELADFPNMSCCGAGVLHEEEPEVSLALNARNLAIAEKAGLDFLTLCNTCLLTMIKAKAELDADKELRERVNRSLAKFGLEYKGTGKVKHLLWVLVQDLGVDKLAPLVKRKLTGLKVAPFYGCHILRPEEVLGFESGRDPHSLEDVIAALGAQAVRYDERTACCGFHVMLVNQSATTGMTTNCLVGASRTGADVLVTPCTLCQLTMDSFQYLADEKAGKTLRLPVLHLPQLVGLALGLDEKALGLDKNFVPMPR